MRKFLLAAALLGAVAACGEKSDDSMGEGGEMAPPAATADTGMTNMGGMANDSMTNDSSTTMAKPDSGSGEM